MAIQRKKMAAKNAARREGEMRSREERRRETQPRRYKKAAMMREMLSRIGGDQSWRTDWARGDIAN
jgi:hypothetical protein